MTVKKSFSDKKIFLASSSLGFRAPLPIGTRFLPFRLKIHSDKRTPWILDYYTSNCIRFYKTGFTIIDLLVYLEKNNISINQHDYAVLNFGIVEGWLRDNFSDNNEDGNWEIIIDRLIMYSYGTKYYNYLLEHKKKTIKENLPKIIISKEIFEFALLDLHQKTKDLANIVFIVFDHKIYKKYTQDYIHIFNETLFSFAKKFNYKILYFVDLKLYDNIHLDYSSHISVADAIKTHFNLQKIHLNWMMKFYYTAREYYAFRRYNTDNYFHSSILQDILNKIKPTKR